MPLHWEKVHVFISSTFNDMHAERDYLVKSVFPELRDWCEKRKLRLVDIDLRWGVTEQDALHNRNVVRVCLNRIDECRPFFICFLGQRRGWVPEVNEISEATIAEYPALSRYVGETSVTEMEIIHALIDPLHRDRISPTNISDENNQPAQYSFVYLRDDSYLNSLPQAPVQLRETFTNDGIEDLDVRAHHNLELRRWREEVLHTKTGRPIRHYQATWDPDEITPELLYPLECPSTEPASIVRWRSSWENAGLAIPPDCINLAANPSLKEQAVRFNQTLSQGRLGNFSSGGDPLSHKIIEDLKQAIAARFPDHSEIFDEDDLQKEIDQNEHFLFTSSEGFIEREGDFQELEAYVEGPSSQLFVLTAPGGTGKSTLLANWIEHYRLRKAKDHNQSIYFRFIGQSDHSSTLHDLLTYFLREVKGLSPHLSKEIPSDFQKLRQEWVSLLAEAGRRSKIVIVIDALNQLSTGLSDLSWLPLQLPQNVKMIVSFKQGDPQAEAYLNANRAGIVLKEVPSFTNAVHRRALVSAYLDQFLKQLDDQILEALINLPGAQNPLYLKVILSELRVFGAFANLRDKIESDFGEDPVAAFNAVLRRLEEDPAYAPIDPGEAVPRLFSFIAHSQHGLSVEDLSGLLIRDLGLPDDEAHRTMTANTIHLFLRQVRPFMATREGRYDFFFESFKLAALSRYVGEGEGQRLARYWHHVLAEHYADQPLILPSEGSVKINIQKITEQPYQQVLAGDGSGLLQTISDYRFLESKIRKFRTYPVLQDLNQAIASQALGLEPSQLDFLKKLEKMIRLNSAALDSFPDQLAGQLFGHFQGLDNPAFSRLLSQAGTKRDTIWIRPLKNSFQTESDFIRLNLTGHTDWVLNASMSSDGRYLASRGKDRLLRVWDLKTGQEKWSTGRFSGIASDGDYYLDSSFNSAELRRIESGDPVRRIALPPGLHIRGISTGGKRLLLGQNPYSMGDPASPIRTRLVLWDTIDNRECCFLEHSARVLECKISSDGLTAVSYDESNQVYVWDLQTGKLIHSISADSLHGGVSLSGNADFAAICHDSSLKIIDIRKGELIVVLEHPERRVMGCCAISADGGYALVDFGGTLLVWDLKNGKIINEKAIHSKKINEIAFTPDGEEVITASEDHTLKVINYDRLISETSGGEAANPSGLVRFSPDGKVAVWAKVAETGTWQGRKVFQAAIQFYDIERNSDKNEISLSSNGRLNKLVFCEDGKTAICLVGGEIAQYETDTWNKVHTFGHGGGCRILGLTPDGNSLVFLGTGSYTGSQNLIQVWDLNTKRLIFDRMTSRGQVGSEPIDVLGNNAYGVFQVKQKLEIVDLIQGNAIHEMDMGLAFPEKKHIFPVALSSDARLLVFGWGRNAIIWDTKEEVEKHVIQASTDSGASVDHVCFSPDAGEILFSTVDGIIRSADLITGEITRTFEGHTGKIIDLRFVPSIQCVVSASEDNTVRIWQLGDQADWATFYLGSQVVDLDIDPSGTNLIMSDGMNRVHLFTIKGLWMN